jgi:hypothetical protein
VQLSKFSSPHLPASISFYTKGFGKSIVAHICISRRRTTVSTDRIYGILPDTSIAIETAQLEFFFDKQQSIWEMTRHIHNLPEM